MKLANHLPKMRWRIYGSFMPRQTRTEYVILTIKYYISLMCLKTFTGLFQSPFILRTFAAHFAAINGACKVKAFGDMHAPEKRPKGGLALAITGVSAIRHL